MRQVDLKLQRLYRLVLKEGYEVTEVFYWPGDKGYTISLRPPGSDDLDAVYFDEWEDVFLKELQ